MDPFEYIVVLSSLILGLGIAQILTGAADVVSHLQSVKLSLPHSLMVLVIFVVHIQDWWETYKLIDQVEVWTLLRVFGGLLVFPVLLFTLARMLFPTGHRAYETDLNKYYSDQWPWFFFIFLLTIIVSICQNMMLLGFTLMDQWPLLLYASTYAAFLVFRFRNKVAHSIFHGLQLVAWSIFVVMDTSTLIIK